MAGREEVREPIVIEWGGAYSPAGGVETDVQESHAPFSEDTLSNANVPVKQGDDAYLPYSVCGYKDKTVMIQAERNWRYSTPQVLHQGTNNSRGYRKYIVYIKVPRAQLTDRGEWYLRAFNAPNGKVLKLRKTLNVEEGGCSIS